MINFFDMTSGSSYVVTRAFADSDNNHISINTKLTYDSKIFNPAKGEYLVIFKETKLRLNEHTQAHIINNLHEYIAAAEPVSAIAESASVDNRSDRGTSEEEQRWSAALSEVRKQTIDTRRPANSKNRTARMLMGIAFFLLGLGSLVTGQFPGRHPTFHDTGYISGGAATFSSILALIGGAVMVYLAIRRNPPPPPYTEAEREALEHLIEVCEKNGLTAQADEARERLLLLVTNRGKQDRG